MNPNQTFSVRISLWVATMLIIIVCQGACAPQAIARSPELVEAGDSVHLPVVRGAPSSALGVWRLQQSGIEGDLTDVAFMGSQLGWAIGSEGELVTTSDGGTQWSEIVPPVCEYQGTACRPHAVEAVPGGVWLGAYCESPMWGILSSADGQTWDSLFERDMWRRGGTVVHLLDMYHGWYAHWTAGYDSDNLTEVRFTVDGGATWDMYGWKYQYEFGSVYDMDFVSAETGWLIGDGGYIARMSGPGAEWQEQFRAEPGAEPYELDILEAIDMYDDQRGLVVGATPIGAERYAPLVLSTTDGGETWARNVLSGTQWLTDVAMVGPSEAWAVGTEGSLFHTEDGGVSWLATPSPTTASLASLCFVDDQHGWAVGDGGVILNYWR